MVSIPPRATDLHIYPFRPYSQSDPTQYDTFVSRDVRDTKFSYLRNIEEVRCTGNV